MANRVESSAVSVVSEDRISVKKCHDDDDSESICNSKSRSAYLGAPKKKLHPLLLGPGRREHGKCIPIYAASKNNLSEFTQRIMSAKLLRVKQVQNQLSEAQIQLNELINENKILKNLQKRQEGALKKYEGNHAELPQLIRSHNEEIRTLKANNKLIKTQLKESNGKLKERENELEILKESHCKLKKLCSEKNLLEREKLQKKVEELQEVIKEQDEKIQLLSRKILLESKNYRHHLNVEINKHKETQKDLNNALAMISRLENQLLMKDRTCNLAGFGKIPHKRETKSFITTISSTSAAHQAAANLENIIEDERVKNKTELSETPETDLELLNGLVSSDDTSSPTHDVLSEINASRKSSTEINYVKTDKVSYKSVDTRKDLIPGNQSHTPKTGTPCPIKKVSISPTNVESEAKDITMKISQSINCVDDLVQNNEIIAVESKMRLDSLYEEVKSNVLKIDEQLKSKSDEIKKESDTKEECETGSGSVRRNVSKRKLGDDKLKKSTENSGLSDEFSLANQEKINIMAKTWNEIKSKVQGERMKAEKKMKELGVMEEKFELCSNPASEVRETVGEEDEESGGTVDDGLPKVKSKMNYKPINFTKDDFIMSELEKTDKVIKRLKEGNKTKAKSPQEIVNFRTKSHTAPKYLDNFQNEYQKQNLLKALKAIDVGKDGNSSSDEPEDCDGRVPANSTSNDAKSKTSVTFPQNKNAKTDLINELFGSSSRKLGRSERNNMEYGIIEGIKTRNN